MKQIKELLAKLNEVDEKEQIKLLLEFSDKQKQKFESMILNSPDMIMNQNPDGKIEYISPQCERILGYTADELKHMDIQTLIYPDDFEETIETTLKTLQGNELTNFEYRFIHKNGDIVWLNHTARPIICDGELTEILSTVRDITKSKKAKEILQNNEARLHSVFSNTSNIAVQSYDKNRKVTYWNKASEALYGYSQEEVINKKLEDLIIPNEMRETVISLIKNWHENNIKIPNSELVLLRKDGSPVHVYSSHVMIDKPDGEKEMFCIDVDISERKHVEKEYHRSMSLLKSAEHLSKTGGWRFTVKDQFMYWTDEAFSIHEIDIKPQTIDTDKQIEDSLLCYDEKDRPIVMKAFQDCIDEGIPYDMEFPFTTKKGNRIWIRTTAKAEYKNNKIVSVIGNIFDITERKQAESKIFQQHEFLNSVLESISSPLHIINVKDYSIVMANSASSIKLTSDKLTCYKATHNLDMPCSGKEHPCPLQNVMETKTPVTVEHIHIDEKGNKRIFEIHGYPIFDKKGEVIQLIEYSIDITERKKAEQALIESEKKRKTWIENSPVCTKVLDLDFNLQFMSKSGIRELKIDDITEFYGKPYPFHFYPDSFKIPMTKNLQKVKQSGKIIEQEASVLDIDGNELWYHSTIVPVFDDNNKLDYFLVISLEITERKQAEDELLESESLHKEAQRVAHIGHWSLDAITGTPTWSDEIYRIFGLKPGKGAPSFTDHDTIVHPEDFPTLDAAIKKGLSDGTNFDLVFRIIKPKGEIGWMHAIGRSKKDQQGNIIYMFGTAQDVIELKLTEEEMLKTQYYLSKAQEIGKTGSWDLDIQKGDLKWTDETYKIFGIPTGKDMTHELFMSCVHPDDRDYLNKSFNNALQKVEPFDIEHRITVNNQVKWLNEKADIKFDTKGNPLFANGFVQDITERKHAEEELRESEKKRSVWIENSPICTKAVDLDFNLMFMSAAGINKLKIDDITKHLGKPYPLSFYPEHYKLSMTESMKKVKETGKSTMHEGSVLDTEGTILWYQSSIVPVYDEKGKLDYILIVSMEITERKLAERSILEAKNRLESIIRNTSAGYFFIDKEGIIQNANDAWVKLYKYDSKEEIIGKHFSVIQQIDDLELANAFVREIMNNNPDYLNGEFSRKCKDGSMGYHNFSANPVYKNYEVIGIEGFIIDITEQKEILLKIQEEQKKNESLLNSIPYPIMLINKKRIVLAANKIALDVGVIVGDYCWKEFGKCECLSDKNLKLSKTNPNEPGIQCTFCRQDEMFETFEPVNNPAVEAFGRIWDTYWIPLNDDEYLHYAIDITEQKEAEQALINSEERFKIMFDYAPDAYYLNDSKGNFIDGNKAAEKLLGYKKEELIGKNLLKFKLIATKELAKASKILLKNIQGKSSGPDELTLLRKDGKQISVEISSYPTRINNQPVVLGIAHDITERNRSRNKLIHYAETQKVLLREVNHRVKNNLSALISMLHKGQDHAEEKGLDSATVLAVMEERIHGLVNVHSMLSHSGWQPIKLSDLCKQIIGESMSSVISTGKVRLIVGKSGVMIGSDLAHHLTMVLNELAMNTLKYALINRDVATITINIKKIKNQVEMCFCDDGPGYPKKLLKGDYSEAGVGFELIQGIVKRSMGGDLQIKNENGAKTIITFENE